jgi:hypothetical protein
MCANVNVCLADTRLIVRVRNKTLLGGRYHSFKAHVLELESDFVAKLQILHGHSCALLKAHQSELETVVPPIGHPLRIVNTKECGEWGIVNAVDEVTWGSALLWRVLCCVIARSSTYLCFCFTGMHDGQRRNAVGR